MTWGEFKKWAEDNGAQNSDVISYIDFNAAPESLEREIIKSRHTDEDYAEISIS